MKEDKEEQEPVLNAIVLGDMVIQSSTESISKLIGLAKSIIHDKELRAYLEHHFKSKAKGMPGLG